MSAVFCCCFFFSSSSSFLFYHCCKCLFLTKNLFLLKRVWWLVFRPKSSGDHIFIFLLHVCISSCSLLAWNNAKYAFTTTATDRHFSFLVSRGALSPVFYGFPFCKTNRFWWVSCIFFFLFSLFLGGWGVEGGGGGTAARILDLKCWKFFRKSACQFASF